MSALKTKTTGENIEWKKFIVTAYIVFSVLFIIYTIYGSLQAVVYQSWINAGRQEGLTAWQQQWYSAAVGEIISNLDGKCETLALTNDISKIDIVNVACVQQQANTPVADSETAQ